MTDRVKFVFSSLIFVAGLTGFIGGFCISWLPIGTIYLGYGVLSVGLFGILCPSDCLQLKAFRIFLVCWAAGAIVTTTLFIPFSLIAMFSTLPIHLPLSALACRVAGQDSRWKHLTKLFYVAAFFLALILPHFLVFTFRKPYPIHPERIEVSSDSLEDKNPGFIDESSMWRQDTAESRFDGLIKYRINKSAAVIGLDFGKLEDSEKAASERIFTTYEQALSYADRSDLPVIPSVQMIDHKAKVFGDQLYAAIEEYMQFEAALLGGGKAGFLRDLLTKLLEARDSSQGHEEATAYIAAGLNLAGQELPELPQGADALRAEYEGEFLSQPIKCKPVGFYAESEELKRIFRQDRFYQTPLTHPAAIVLAKIMADNPDLRTKYKSILSLYSRMTNPPSRFSVDDVAEYAECFDDPSALMQKMLTSEKWKILCRTGAGRDPGEGEAPSIQFLPHSTSKENQLFAGIYNYSSELPQHNVMNRLIKAIRSGELDLTPKTDSGWYDYQIHALETFLVTEKGQESDKLLLSEKYKKRLIEAFKTILTKKRELHVKQVELIPTLGVSLAAQYLTISPDLHIEPTATYYLRTARGFRFLLDSLEAILGKSSLEGIVVGEGKSVLAGLEDMAKLYYGLYLQVCDDIGMKPEFLPEEMPDAQILQARQQTEKWLTDYEAESFFEKDVRYIVPALTNLRRTEVRYWMVLGVKLLKIRAEYVKRPQVRILNVETDEVHQQIPTDTESGSIIGTHLQYKFAPEEYFLPIEVFAEATGPPEPLTREEFRNLCEKHKTRERIIAAIQSRTALTISKPAIIAVIASALIVASIALLRLITKKRTLSL